MAKILFIEDNEAQLSIIKFLKLAYKHEITWAMNVGDAISIIDSVEYDFYIVDIMMKTDDKIIPRSFQNYNGKKTGLYLLNRILEKNEYSKIIILTARDDLKDELKKYSILKYFVKPTSPHLIHKAIIENI